MYSSGKLKLCFSDGHFSGDYSGEGSSDVNDLKVLIWLCACTYVMCSASGQYLIRRKLSFSGEQDSWETELGWWTWYFTFLDLFNINRF
jgi:hypothetical protein